MGEEDPISRLPVHSSSGNPMTRSLQLALTEPQDLEICTKEGVGPGIPASEQSLDPVPGDIPEATLPREGP